MKISGVKENSIAREAGLEPGDKLLSINNEIIDDMLDYGYYSQENDILVSVEKNNGEIWDIEISNYENEDLGIIFDECIEDNIKGCSNKCIFCFIDQLPDNMRETLYFKDDDLRMSFLHGNYVTLTNTNSNDIEKIIRYRMSPVNVSVHTTNPKLRREMMNNKNAGNVLKLLKEFIENGISINCQIVLCKGINDGLELRRTIDDLTGLGGYMNSLSIVPVGITSHRKGLYELKHFTKNDALEIIELVYEYQKSLLKKTGSRKVYLADEFFIKAGLDFPEYEEYEEFPQLENGVGMMRLFLKEASEFLYSQESPDVQERNISIATGMSALSFINKTVSEITKKYDKLNINVYGIENKFLGEHITVAGLLTGQDIIAQLKGKELGDMLYITESMLKADEKVLLDNISTDMIEERLNVKVRVVENNGYDFIKKIISDK
jgi:putative radical SAM enzyme (TIGR03279 family)